MGHMEANMQARYYLVRTETSRGLTTAVCSRVEMPDPAAGGAIMTRPIGRTPEQSGGRGPERARSEARGMIARWHAATAPGMGMHVFEDVPTLLVDAALAVGSGDWEVKRGRPDGVVGHLTPSERTKVFERSGGSETLHHEEELGPGPSF